MEDVLLTTERLVLREFDEPDWRVVHDYASDPKVVRYMEWGPNTEEETRDYIRRAMAFQQEQPRKNYEFAVVLKAEEQLIGGCGISMSDPDSREGGIGYCFNPSFWRQGYATEAARQLLVFGFGQAGLHRIFATCDPANTDSRRVLEKIGMQREGRLREHVWAKGKWRDSFLYAILDYEWERSKDNTSE